jgi:putative redox protein
MRFDRAILGGDHPPSLRRLHMVEMSIRYLGGLRCEAVHGPSDTRLITDAPTDNMGKGESFSPTDLVATALGSCILTTMGIVAQRQGIDMAGARVHVAKEMVTSPHRRIGRLPVTIHMPRELSEDDRKRLENAAHTCPVHRSLHPDVEAPISFRWGDG